jgi:molybdopterin converting factor small subunit
VRVQVRLGSGLSRIVGRPQLSVELPGDATVADLLHQLGAAYPALGNGIDRALTVSSGSHVSVSQPLRDGEEISLLLPAAGG